MWEKEAKVNRNKLKNKENQVVAVVAVVHPKTVYVYLSKIRDKSDKEVIVDQAVIVTHHQINDK